MKLLKGGVILGVLASAAMGCLWLLDLVPGDEASRALQQILGVVAILTVALFVVFLVAGRGKSAP